MPPARAAGTDVGRRPLVLHLGTVTDDRRDPRRRRARRRRRVQPAGRQGGPTPSWIPSFEYPAALIDGATIGKADAPVTLEVWGDFQCPICARHSLTVEPASWPTSRAREPAADRPPRDRDPGRPHANDESKIAAVGAYCAIDQGRYWDYAHWVYANQEGENNGGFAPERLTSIAQAAGVDVRAFPACLDEFGTRRRRGDDDRGRGQPRHLVHPDARDQRPAAEARAAHHGGARRADRGGGRERGTQRVAQAAARERGPLTRAPGPARARRSLSPGGEAATSRRDLEAVRGPVEPARGRQRPVDRDALPRRRPRTASPASGPERLDPVVVDLGRERQADRLERRSARATPGTAASIAATSVGPVGHRARHVEHVRLGARGCGSRRPASAPRPRRTGTASGRRRRPCTGRPRTAATIALVGPLVMPWSRPTPYTVIGRRPMLGMPSSSQ